jgi:hypothetical protein
MSQPGPTATPAARNSGIDDELARYGIRRVPADYFVYRSYRYTNLADALAQAKLEQAHEE